MQLLYWKAFKYCQAWSPPSPGAFGLALDETNNTLYVSDNTPTARYYSTTTWAYHSIDIYFNSQPRPAVGIAVDPTRGYLYTGNFYGTGYNHTSLVRTLTAPPYTSIETDIGYPVIGIDVDKSTGLVYCTTRVAVALRYEAKTTEAPILVAKGAGPLAEKIREIARAYGVPVVRRPELARTIYSTVETGSPIPELLYVTVAEILAMIYRLRHKKS